jgi:predicted nucleic-acid-binding protein
MIGIDSNVLVRYLTRDDADQYGKAKHLFENDCNAEQPGYINSVVLCEVAWVLKCAYGVSRGELARIIEIILLTQQFEVADRDAVWAALYDFQNSSADFADCLICQLNRRRGCAETVTFDLKAGELEDFRLL